MTTYKIYTIEQGLIKTNNGFDFENLTYHREDGPALIKYYDNGNIEYEEYWINNIRHRLDGPAYIEYDETGKAKYQDYYINGKFHTNEYFFKTLLKLKINLL